MKSIIRRDRFLILMKITFSGRGGKRGNHRIKRIVKYRERTLDQCYEKAGIEDAAVLFRVNKEFLIR